MAHDGPCDWLAADSDGTRLTGRYFWRIEGHGFAQLPYSPALLLFKMSPCHTAIQVTSYLILSCPFPCPFWFPEESVVNHLPLRMDLHFYVPWSLLKIEDNFSTHQHGGSGPKITLYTFFPLVWRFLVWVTFRGILRQEEGCWEMNRSPQSQFRFCPLLWVSESINWSFEFIPCIWGSYGIRNVKGRAWEGFPYCSD